jgi:hypothetical protein
MKKRALWVAAVSAAGLAAARHSENGARMAVDALNARGAPIGVTK